MFLFNLDSLSKQTKRIIYLITQIFSLVLLLFIIVAVPCLCCVNGANAVLITGKNDSEIALSVLIPFLASVSISAIGGYFKSFGKQEAINQLDTQLSAGVISLDHYIKSLEHIENLDLNKKKAKIDLASRKEKAIYEHKEKAKREIQKAKENMTKHC